MTHCAFIVTGLGYGDEGKGTIVDALVRKHGANLVVRFNGGAQAAHSVVDGIGRTHTFSQFGSGTFVPGVKTFLSSYTLFDPPALYFENAQLKGIGVSDAMDRLYVDRKTTVVTPYHINANRILEYIRVKKHGSCGRGVGQAVLDSIDYPTQTIRVEDLRQPDVLKRKMNYFRELRQSELYPWATAIKNTDADPYILEEIRRLYDPEEFDFAMEEFMRIGKLFTMVGSEFLENHFTGDGVTIFEGAQGILLDQDFGFHPHNTWSKTTSANAISLLTDAAAGDTEVRRVGVTRAYSSRHGAGPFPTEDPAVEPYWEDQNNTKNIWQGSFRYGWLDMNLLKYAIEVNGGIDELAITCLDHLGEMPEELAWKIGAAYLLERKPWRLRHNPAHTYKQMEAIGTLLEKVNPVYITEGPRSMEEYGHFVARSLGVPLAIASIGSRYEDKMFYSYAPRKVNSDSAGRFVRTMRREDMRARRDPKGGS